MYNHELYVIYDKIAKESGPIFQAKNKEIALRNFHNLAKRENFDQSEYELYLIGRYAPETMDLYVINKMRIWPEEVTNE